MDPKLTRYKKLKKCAHDLGIVIPGTLRTIYQRCGKPNCRCATGKSEDKHGPYLLWDKRKRADGVLSSTSINPNHKKLLQEGINNRRKLEKLVREMLKIGEKYAANLKK